MAEQLIEIVISGDGGYVDLNEAGSAILGYSTEELRRLPFGAISGNEPGAAAVVWRRFVVDGLDIPPHPNVRLHAKGGERVAVRFLGTVAGETPGTFVSRYRLIAGRAIATNRPFLVQTLLTQWRALERRIAELAPADPERERLEADLAELKALYAYEVDRRATEP